jgi:hypothetical protein
MSEGVSAGRSWVTHSLLNQERYSVTGSHDPVSITVYIAECYPHEGGTPCLRPGRLWVTFLKTDPAISPVFIFLFTSPQGYDTTDPEAAS